MICIVLNLYLVLAVLLYKKLRELQFFMIAVQATSDIIGCGVGGVLLYIVEINYEQMWGIDYIEDSKGLVYDVSCSTLAVPAVRRYSSMVQC